MMTANPSSSSSSCPDVCIPAAHHKTIACPKRDGQKRNARETRKKKGTLGMDRKGEKQTKDEEIPSSNNALAPLTQALSHHALAVSRSPRGWEAGWLAPALFRNGNAMRLRSGCFAQDPNQTRSQPASPRLQAIHSHSRQRVAGKAHPSIHSFASGAPRRLAPVRTYPCQADLLLWVLARRSSRSLMETSMMMRMMMKRHHRHQKQERRRRQW
ncbi:hypothetical protein BC567DRAFT_228862 [Phyllosticta citribraziliensis]